MREPSEQSRFQLEEEGFPLPPLLQVSPFLGFDPKGASLLFCARDSLVTTRWDKARKSNKPNPDAFPLLCKLACVLILLPEPCRSPRWLAKSLRRLQATWPEASLEAPSPVSHQFRHGGGSQGVLLPNFWSG